MTRQRNLRFTRIIVQYCRQRLPSAFPPVETAKLEAYLLRCFETGEPLPYASTGWSWCKISSATEIDVALIRNATQALTPILDAMKREFQRAPQNREKVLKPPHKNPAAAAKRKEKATQRPQKKAITHAPATARPASAPKRISQSHRRAAPKAEKRKNKRRSGPKIVTVIEFPAARWDAWDDTDSFRDALVLHMKRHGDTSYSLRRAICRPTENFNRTTLVSWAHGKKSPRTVESLKMLSRIERRYRLPSGYFKAKLPHPSRSISGQTLVGISEPERRRLAWHLPDDFDDREISEQEDILRWVRETIVSGGTEYRRYQAAAIKNRYAVQFETEGPVGLKRPYPPLHADDEMFSDLTSGVVQAPKELAAEVAGLAAFKQSTLTTLGYQRNGVWGSETAAQRIEHLGLLFGALSAPPDGPVRGFGAKLKDLSVAHLLFPTLWDWYLRWRERRRGFYTSWEVSMLQLAASLTRSGTGWIRQTPELSSRLRPIAHLVSLRDVQLTNSDWEGACDRMYKHAMVRIKEIGAVAAVHRDPFEPILPILEADSPLAEYRKIADEILRLMPDERLYPISVAESVRSLLLIRFGLHTGLRQKNLRQLLVCHRGREPTPERQLVNRKVGELRWNERSEAWEVFIPTCAFKNAGSSFFGNSPFRLQLPDLGGLYGYIDTYLARHRPRLLRSARDPGTFFIKTVKVSSQDAAYDINTFYEAWRLTIQRFGIYNPYTQRGAIKGLLPHGPHNVRDVLATHILKITGSYEQASYAIQDTPEVVAKHYGRFLPQDKAALAAKILNQVWATT